MKCPKSALVAIAVFLSASACSEQSLVSPDAQPANVNFAVQASAGTYAIIFLKETNSGLAPAADAEPVGTYLVLKSQITDGNGNPAETGTVTYEVCSVKGGYAPSAACASGSGTWKRYYASSVDSVGSLVGFGACSTPRSIGFRVSYGGKRGGIASGVSAARDFTWTSP